MGIIPTPIYDNEFLMKSPQYFLILIFLFGYSAFSQEETSLNSGGFNTVEEQFSILNTINSSRSNLGDNGLINQQNNIFIQQIGDYNRVYSQTQSLSSNIDLVQNGDFNNIHLEVNAPSINANVIQNGDNNTVLDVIYYSNQDVGLNAIQNGNNLTINRIGVNSLSNKLQLVQEGSFKTITVISN